MKRFEELRQLEEDWDSYGGQPPTKAAIEAAEKIHNNLAYVPVRDGSIQIEFHAAGADVEIAVNPEGKVVYVGFETKQ